MRQIQNGFHGRNGFDQLTIALAVVLFLLLAFHQFTGDGFYSIVAFGVLLWGYFRVLSKNISARQRENDYFLDWWEPFFGRIQELIGMAQNQRTHCRLICPSCGQKIRVPRGRGTISIICPSCGQAFIRKT